jgi:hypothetical protein
MIISARSKIPSPSRRSRRRPCVQLVGQADGLAAVLLHHDLVAVVDEFARAGRRQADAVLVVLDFLRNADKHGALPGRMKAAHYSVCRPAALA